MKTLVITNHSYMLWQFRRELIEALLQRGEVLISTPFVGHEADFAALGCRCLETRLERRGTDPRQELGLCRFYRRLIRAEKPDLVLTYSIKPNIYACLACRRLGVRYAANVQGLGTAFQRPLMAAAASALYRAALKRAHTVFFENAANARLFAHRRIVPAARQTLLPGAGVNLCGFPLVPYPAERGCVRLLYLGRIMREKGMDELLCAIRAVKAALGERVRFDLVGFFEEAYRDRVEAMAREGLLIFHGFQSDPRPYYAAAHALVLPSYHEGMSNVLLEAGATGRALICSDIPGCREAVAPDQSGYLVPAGNAQALTEAILRFCSLSESQRAAMGLRSRERMESQFDRTRVVEQTMAALFG